MRVHRSPLWWQDSVCRGVGTELFFSDDEGDQAVARAMCRRCPVKDDCLADALARTAALLDAGVPENDHGLFADTLPADRLRLLSGDLSQYSDTHALELT